MQVGSSSKKARRGVTLAELLSVLGICAVLTGVYLGFFRERLRSGRNEIEMTGDEITLANLLSTMHLDMQMAAGAREIASGCELTVFLDGRAEKISYVQDGTVVERRQGDKRHKFTFSRPKGRDGSFIFRFREETK